MRDLANDSRLLSINWATVREQLDHRGLCEGLARAGIGGISPWREPVQAMGVAAAAKSIRDAGLTVSGYCRGGLFTNQGTAAFKAVLADNRRALDEAAALGARCLVMVVGSLLPGSKDIAAARALQAEGLAELLPYARAVGVPLALEPLHPMTAADRSTLSTLGQALDLCDALDPGAKGGIGVAIDVYHVWWDPQLEAQIARAGRGKRILAFHVCDWLVPTRDLVTDRGMMGDGVIDIPGIRGKVEAAGYDGPIEAEIFSSANWWKRPAEEVLATCLARHRTVV